ARADDSRSPTPASFLRGSSAAIRAFNWSRTERTWLTASVSREMSSRTRSPNAVCASRSACDRSPRGSAATRSGDVSVLPLTVSRTVDAPGAPAVVSRTVAPPDRIGDREQVRVVLADAAAEVAHGLQVVENPQRPAVRRQHEVVVLDDQIVDGDGRQIELQR